MYLEVILAIVIINYLRKKLRMGEYSPQLNRQLVVGFGIAVGLLVLQAVLPNTRSIADWLTHALMLVILYNIFYRPELKAVKFIVYVVLPYLVIEIINDAVKVAFSGAYERSWENYFQTAKFFAFLWMVAMWFVSKRQRAVLEKERLKALEKEREFQESESLKAALEVQVAERTAALTQQKNELQQTITELKSTQAQLIQSEKMASLGELTAGIAHEIQNPLNFVNNFAEVNAELIAEMKEALAKGDLEDAKAIAGDIAENEKKISHHGKRADAIVKGMLQHSRSSSGVKEPTDINALADEYLRLAYHGLRAKDKSFNAGMKTDFDETIGNIDIVPQDIGRVILNLITNAFYAVAEKKKLTASETAVKYEPTVTVRTEKKGDRVAITVQDNGNGIPQQALDKIFQPFFTTKPTGQGTGLGLSMSYDIVTKGHGGELKVSTNEGEGAVFTVSLPLKK